MVFTSPFSHTILPGGLSVTVSNPLRLVRPPLEPPITGECVKGGSIGLLTVLGGAGKSSVHPTVCRFEQPRPCIYLTEQNQYNFHFKTSCKIYLISKYIY